MAAQNKETSIKRKSSGSSGDNKGTHTSKNKDGAASFKKHKGNDGKGSSSTKKNTNTNSSHNKATPTPAATNNDSLSSSAQKRQVRKDRQSHRRHADAVGEAKSLWNKLRQKSNTPDDTIELMDKVMTLITGKVNEIALQHDASRVVQAAIQFGTETQRKELLVEICQSDRSLVELSKIQYAHFICLKFIKYCARDEASIKLIVKVRGDNNKHTRKGLSSLYVISLLLMYIKSFRCDSLSFVNRSHMFLDSMDFVLIYRHLRVKYRNLLSTVSLPKSLNRSL
jgi:hypothetical protein